MNNPIAFFLIMCLVIYSCKQSKNECEPSGTLIADGARSEADIVFTTEDEKYWREGQWGEKIDGKKLVDAVFDAVYKGKVIPYDFFSNKPLGVDKIKRMESRVDTMYIENPTTGAMEMKVVETKLERGNDITKVFFKEKWFLDEENFKLSKKVTGLTLTTKKFNDSGDFMGTEPLFTVYFDPEYSKIIHDSAMAK